MCWLGKWSFFLFNFFVAEQKFTQQVFEGQPPSVSAAIIPRCFTVGDEKQVKCQRPTEGNHGQFL